MPIPENVSVNYIQSSNFSFSYKMIPHLHQKTNKKKNNNAPIKSNNIFKKKNTMFTKKDETHLN